MFDEIVVQYGMLAGFAALVTLIINVLKHFGVIKDGAAQTWSLVANGAIIIIMYTLKIIKPDFEFASLDSIAAEVATVGNFIFQLVVQLFVSKVTHATVSGVPVVGYSYSLEAQKLAELESDVSP